jgi:sporulation protein YlmC with PRC-barrel domain
MKRRFALTAIAALTLALGASIAAGQTSGTGSSTSAPASKSTTTTRSGATGTSQATLTSERAHRASRIIGMDVVNRQGEKVGDIEDIVLDRNGNAAYAVVSTGGFLGIGEKLHAIPWRSLQTNTGADKFVLDISKDRLSRAPGFDANNWPNVNDPKWSAENRKHFPEAGQAGTSSTAATSRDRTTGMQESGKKPATSGGVGKVPATGGGTDTK